MDPRDDGTIPRVNVKFLLDGTVLHHYFDVQSSVVRKWVIRVCMIGFTWL